MDRALEAAKEYRALRERGDVVGAGVVRQTIEDLHVGEYVDGKYVIAANVRAATDLES